MEENEQPTVPYEELKKFVIDPSRMNAKIVGYRKTHPNCMRKQTIDEVIMARARYGSSSQDLLITPAAVQEMIDTGRLVIRDEPERPVETSLFRLQVPSPNAFLEKYNLRRPGQPAASRLA